MKKFKVTYKFVGEIEIEAEDNDDLISCFNDQVGFSNDDLYENLDHTAEIISIEEDI